MANVSTQSGKRFKPVRWLALIGLPYLGVTILLTAFETSILFPAPPLDYGYWDPMQFGAQETFVENDKIKIHTWLFGKEGAKTTLVFCHGNGESIGTIGAEMAMMRSDWNVNVIAFDYRGYGKTGGTPGESNHLSDARCIGEYVRKLADAKSQKVIVMGRSLGGALAVEIASHSTIDGLILDRTFSSLVDVAAVRYFLFPVRLLMKNQFRSIDKISNYTGPLLQVHGEADELVPMRFGKALFQACPSSNKQWITVPGMKHNDEWPSSVYFQAEKFVASISEQL